MSAADELWAAGLGVIWECDNCHAIAETGLDDEPGGWLVEEPDEDNYPEDAEVPIDLLLCGDCRFPNVIPAAQDESRDADPGEVQTPDPSDEGAA